MNVTKTYFLKIYLNRPIIIPPAFRSSELSLTNRFLQQNFVFISYFFDSKCIFSRLRDSKEKLMKLYSILETNFMLLL
jgi:hypothetical protein